MKGPQAKLSYVATQPKKCSEIVCRIAVCIVNLIRVHYICVV